MLAFTDGHSGFHFILNYCRDSIELRVKVLSSSNGSSVKLRRREHEKR